MIYCKKYNLVYDAKGVRKYDGAEYAKEGENTHEVDVTTLTKGLYIVRVLTKGKLLAEKFIPE